MEKIGKRYTAKRKFVFSVTDRWTGPCWICSPGDLRKIGDPASL